MSKSKLCFKVQLGLVGRGLRQLDSHSEDKVVKGDVWRNGQALGGDISIGDGGCLQMVLGHGWDWD